MRIEVVSSLRDVDAAAWDALVGEHNPFVEHAFLSLLEDSGSVGEEEGWEPMHLTVWEGERLVGAAPVYRKDHSYGEYIFDWSWADASYRLGLPYYPKLVVAVPFTPATGPRLLVHPEARRDRVWKALADGLRALCKASGSWSAHILFCMDEEAEFLHENGYLRRGTHQFHWRNDGYACFDDFLAAMQARSRKQTRRERRRVQEAGVEVTLQRGDEVSQDDWRQMYALYMSTSARKWGQPYLTRAFFEGALERIGSRALLCFAKEQGEVVAGTLSFAKGDHIYGRYWGAFKRIDGLHFELCYYRLIEHAIEHGCLLVEAGAQGSHKLKRGFLPVMTHSAHFFTQKELGSVFAIHTRQEAKHLEEELAMVQTEGPFREDGLPNLPPCAGIDLHALCKKPK